MEEKLKQKENSKKRKRKQVKVACLNCRRAHTGCDMERPCRRCVVGGISDSCTDSGSSREKKKMLKVSEEFTVMSKTKEKPVRKKLESIDALTRVESLSVLKNKEKIKEYRDELILLSNIDQLRLSEIELKINELLEEKAEIEEDLKSHKVILDSLENSIVDLEEKFQAKKNISINNLLGLSETIDHNEINYQFQKVIMNTLNKEVINE
jgi:hypothetical protein